MKQATPEKIRAELEALDRRMDVITPESTRDDRSRLGIELHSKLHVLLGHGTTTKAIVDADPELREFATDVTRRLLRDVFDVDPEP